MAAYSSRVLAFRVQQRLQYLCHKRSRESTAQRHRTDEDPSVLARPLPPRQLAQRRRNGRPGSCRGFCERCERGRWRERARTQEQRSDRTSAGCSHQRLPRAGCAMGSPTRSTAHRTHAETQLLTGDRSRMLTSQQYTRASENCLQLLDRDLRILDREGHSASGPAEVARARHGQDLHASLLAGTFGLPQLLS